MRQVPFGFLRLVATFESEYAVICEQNQCLSENRKLNKAKIKYKYFKFPMVAVNQFFQIVVYGHGYVSNLLVKYSVSERNSFYMLQVCFAFYVERTLKGLESYWSKCLTT